MKIRTNYIQELSRVIGDSLHRVDIDGFDIASVNMKLEISVMILDHVGAVVVHAPHFPSIPMLPPRYLAFTTVPTSSRHSASSGPSASSGSPDDRSPTDSLHCRNEALHLVSKKTDNICHKFPHGVFLRHSL